MAQEQTVNLTRRQAIAALGAGAAVLAATNLGVAYESAQWARQAPLAQASDLAGEVDKLKGLVALYEGLEKIGIDAIIAAGMSAFKGTLDALRGGVGALRAGVDTVEGTISGFRNTFAAIREGLKAADDGVSNVAALLKNAEDTLGQATSPIRPLVEQLRDFFDNLLSKIPFGVGDDIRKAIGGITGLVAAIPTMVKDVTTQLLEPLRTGWFSDDNAKNIQGALLDPITQKVLEPLKGFLGDVDKSLAHWESDMATPVQTALDQRSAVRKQIADYRKAHGLD